MGGDEMQWLLDNLYWLLPLTITSVITPVVTYIVGRNRTSKETIIARLDDNDRKTNLNMQVSVSILRRELKDSASLLIAQGSATIKDKEMWQTDYELYESVLESLSLKNGLIEHLRTEVLALPIRREDD